MPDISMCQDTNCPSKMKCYRFRAKPNPHRQSYANFKHLGQACGYFMNIDGWDKRNIRDEADFENKLSGFSIVSDWPDDNAPKDDDASPALSPDDEDEVFNTNWSGGGGSGDGGGASGDW